VLKFFIGTKIYQKKLRGLKTKFSIFIGTKNLINPLLYNWFTRIIKVFSGKMDQMVRAIKWQEILFFHYFLCVSYLTKIPMYEFMIAHDQKTVCSVKTHVVGSSGRSRVMSGVRMCVASIPLFKNGQHIFKLAHTRSNI